MRRVPHKRLSEAFDVLTLDLQARANAATAKAGACAEDSAAPSVDSQTGGAPSDHDSSRPFHGQRQGPRNTNGAHSPQDSGWEHDSYVEVPVTADGLCNAVLVWFEADLGGGHSLSSWHGGCGSHSVDGQLSDTSAAGTPGFDGHGRLNGAVGSSGDQRSAGLVSGPEPDGPTGAAIASSWSQGIQYLDGIRAQRVRVEP